MGKRSNNSQASKEKTPAAAQKPRVPRRKLDDCCRECFSVPVRICDLLNNTIIREHGMRPLNPNDVEVLDTHMFNAKGKSVQKQNPETLLAVYKAGTSHTLDNLQCMFNVEYLLQVDYFMPFRSLGYINYLYSRQIKYLDALKQRETEVAAAQAREEPIPEKPKRRKAAAFYDCLVHCYSVIFHLGGTPWTAPLTIYDAADPDPNYGELSSNYRYHLIDPCAIPDDVFSCFSTDVGLLLKVLKYQKDPNKLEQFSQDPAFANVDGPVARFIDTAANVGLSKVIDMEGVTVNMCEGLQMWAEEVDNS